jgi:hypothetical protein
MKKLKMSQSSLSEAVKRESIFGKFYNSATAETEEEIEIAHNVFSQPKNMITD